jgi:hypothetical protein
VPLRQAEKSGALKVPPAGGGGVSIDGGEAFNPGDGAGGLLGNSNSTMTCPSTGCGLDQNGNFIGALYIYTSFGHLWSSCTGPFSNPAQSCTRPIWLAQGYQYINGYVGLQQDQDPYPNDGSILSQIMNDPSLAGNWTRTFNSARDWVTAATVATTAATAGAFVGGEAATTEAGDYFFARGTGLLNSGDYLRIGWGWYGGNIIDYLPTGGLVFRIVVGNPNSPIRWHIWPF